MLQFKRRYRSKVQQDRLGHPDRVVVIETALYDRLLTIAEQEQCSLKEAASRILEVGLDFYEKQRYNEHTTE